MRLKDVKLGEKYHLSGSDQLGPVTAEAVEKADRKNGVRYSQIICVDSNGRREKHFPDYLTPWAEHLNNQRVKELEKAEILAQVNKIKSAVGEGVEIAGEPINSFVRLLFTEPVAEKILEKAGAKPLPDNRRPSKVDQGDQEAYERICVLLGQRIRRALGVGYAGAWTSSEVKSPYVAEVFFYDGSVADAAAKLTGEEKQGNISPLSELVG